MEYKDYYKTLGVDRNADEKEIKKAYRRLARQYHPDVNPGDKAAEARFKEINEANEVLSDPEKRRKYDALGQQYQRWQQTGGQPGGFDWSQWVRAGQPGATSRDVGGDVRVEYADLSDLFGSSGFSDFFEAIFGGASSGSRGARHVPARGRDLEHEVEITLEDAFSGAQLMLEMNGRKLEVQIPAGVKTGSRVRVTGEGLPGAGNGPRGDLYLRIRVMPHPTFERREAKSRSAESRALGGDDLHCEFPVDLFTALLGGEARVPTLSGPVVLRIPAGTQTGKVFRLSGQGMPNLRAPHGRGALYARARVTLPERLSEKEQELVREWARLRGSTAT
jgi:curved DNA-binding protein